MKKFLVVFVCVAFVLSMFSACSNAQKGNDAETSAGITSAAGTTPQDGAKEAGKLFSEPVKFSLFVSSNPSWPYQENWPVFKMISDKTNATFEVIPVADADYNTKVGVTIASGELPDLMYLSSDISKRYGAEGAFINVLEYEKDMPDFSGWKKENTSKILGFLAADGKMYQFPANEIGEANRMGWMYREDIFKKHGLQLPKDQDEFYSVCKKLKELYPDTFPLTFRNGLKVNDNRIIQMAPSWGASLNYFFKDNQWKYGPLEDGFKNMTAFMNKLYTEKLIPADFLSIDTKAWVDRISTEQGFITYDYLTRIDFFNSSIRKEKPEFTMAYMPPWKGGETGSAKDIYTSENNYGFCVAAKSPLLKEAVRYCDWLYSEEATQLLSWGVEGETYKEENGVRKLINAADLTEFRKNTGLSTIGTYLRFDYNAHISTFSPELSAAYKEDAKYDMEPSIPSSFTSDEQQFVSTTGQAIDKHRDEMVSKFIIGQRDMAEWDKFKEEITNLGLEKMLEIYKNSHERLKNAMN